MRAAVRDYIAAWAAIREVQRRRDDDVEALQRQITEVTDRATERIAGHEAVQARAAARIHAQGHTDDDIADLLEITPKRVRRLVATARAEDESAHDEASEHTTGRVRTPPAGEEADRVVEDRGSSPTSPLGDDDERPSPTSGAADTEGGHSGL